MLMRPSGAALADIYAQLQKRREALAQQAANASQLQGQLQGKQQQAAQPQALVKKPAAVTTPGATKPYGARRSALGPLLQMLRQQDEHGDV